MTSEEATAHARLLVTLMLHGEDLPISVAEQFGTMSREDMIDVTFALANLSATLVDAAATLARLDTRKLWAGFCTKVEAA